MDHKIKLLCSLYNRNVINITTRRQKLLQYRLRVLRLKHQTKVKMSLSENIIFIENILNNMTFRASPRLWMKNRSKEWWQRMYESSDTQDWLDNFRGDKDTFQYLCRRLSSKLKPKENSVREPLSVELKMAITLYKLASCAEYRVVGNLFGVHKASVHRSVKQVCNAIVDVLLPEEIKMPSLDEKEIKIADFEKFYKIPQIFGAIDGTHIPITPPTESYRDYINRKCWPSLILQGVVDQNYRFISIAINNPGSAHDATVLKDSCLYRNMTNFERPSRVINGREVKAFLIGDPAYPLLEWLIKGYVSPQTAQEESFNTYLSRGRICVENAFGKLKSRWRILQKRMDVDITLAPKIIAACCVLHNVIQNKTDVFLPQWTTELEESNKSYPQPTRTTSHTPNSFAAEIREVLKNYMAQNFELRTSQLN